MIGQRTDKLEDTASSKIKRAYVKQNQAKSLEELAEFLYQIYRKKKLQENQEKR